MDKIISRCLDCGWRNGENTQFSKFFCNYSNDTFHLDDIKNIPDNCPLPSVDNKLKENWSSRMTEEIIIRRLTKGFVVLILSCIVMSILFLTYMLGILIYIIAGIILMYIVGYILEIFYGDMDI